MKILLICPEPIGKGGIGTYVYNIVSGFLSLNRKDIEIVLLMRGFPKEVPREFSNLQIINILGGLIKWYKEVTKFLLKNCKKIDWIEDSEFGASSYYACKLSKDVRKKLIIRLHTNTKIVKFFEGKTGLFEQMKTKIIDHMERYVTKNAKLVTAPSRAIAEIECIMWQISLEKLRIIPNPIKLPIDVSEKNIIAEEFGVEDYVLYFGRLQKRKGIFDFISSINYVKNREIMFVIIGADPFNIKERIKRLLPRNLKDRIIFRDYLPRDKLMRVIKDAKVVVLPSLFENFSYTILETMALGVPLITTNAGGTREIITHLKNGFLIEPNKPKQIAKWINFVLDERNRNFINKIRKNALNTARKFEAKKIARIYLKILEEEHTH